MTEPNTERTVHLGDYARVIWRRWLLVLAIWMAVFGGVALYTYTRPQLYRASAQLVIERQVSLTGLGNILPPATEEFYQTQYLLLRSRDVARKLFAWFQMDSWPMFQQIRDQDRYEVVQNWIRITPQPKSHMVEVWMLWGDRMLAAEMVNKVTDFYLAEVQSRQEQAGSRAAQGLTSRVNLLEGNIRDADSQISAFRRTYGLYAEREGINSLLGRMNQTISQLGTAREELAKAEAENSAMQEALSRSESIIAGKDTEYLNNLRTRLQLIDEQYAVQKQATTPKIQAQNQTDEIYNKQKSAVAGAIAEEMDRLKKDRISEVTQRLAQAKTNYSRLEAELTDIEPRVSQYQFRMFELERMEKQAVLLRDIVDTLKKGAENLNVQRAVEETMAYVESKAEPSPEESYYTPRYGINLGLGLVVGLLVGLAGAFFSEYLNTTIRLPSDIQDNLNLPLLGFVPAMPGVVRSFMNRGKIAHLASRSGAAEAYRSLRTELLLSCSPERTCKTVMVTSTSPQEGKTTVASNLAITMAQAGYRVLLMDADLRKPTVHEIFGLDNENGLSTLLAETGEARVYIRKTEVENLHVLPGGPAPVNPSELLGSRKMRTLIAETSERYDVVVMDSSPVLGVADASILATMADAVVLVIQASKSKRAHVVRARNQLLGVNARVVGAVLNNVRGSRGDYYYYRRYYSPVQIRGLAEQNL